MRRALLGLALALGACGAPPAPIAPAPVSIAPASAAPPAPPATPVATLEIAAKQVIARDAGGRELFRAKIEGAAAARPAPGGGAYVVTRKLLLRLDALGAERWRAPHAAGLRIGIAPSLVVVAGSARADLFDAEDGSPRGSLTASSEALVREGPPGTPRFRLPLRLFPGGPSRRVDRVLAVGEDGVALAGAADGSLIAVDLEGRPRWELGVRGAVTAVAAIAGGGFEVRTAEGPWRLDSAGAVLAEPPLRPRPTLAFRAQPVERAPDLVFGPDDAWALEHRYDDGVREQRLHHWDGKRWEPVTTPELALMRQPLFTGEREFAAQTLARGPLGQLLVIGLSQLWMKNAPAMESVELRVLERVGTTFRDRPDLARAFEKTAQHIESSAGRVSRAAGPGGREVYCVVDACLGRGLPPSFRPSKESAPELLGKGPWSFFEWPSGAMWFEPRPMAFAGPTLWRIDSAGLRRGAELMLPFDAIEEEVGLRSNSGISLMAIWATGEDDLWAVMGNNEHGSRLVRWDGKALQRVTTPLRRAHAIGGSGPKDVWIAGDGVARFDGSTWQRIAGVPGGSIVAGARGDLWVDRWHLEPERAAPADLVGTPAPAPPAAAPSHALAIGPLDGSVRLTRASIAVTGDAPLTSALSVVEGPGGVTWLHDRHRLVELDAGAATARLLHRAGPADPLPCQRCGAPSARGEGVLLSRGPDGMTAIRQLSGGRAPEALWLPGLLSVTRAADGAVWAVSAADDDGSPRAVVRDAAGLVAGVPPGAYADVAAFAAADVWLAGGLTAAEDGVRLWPEGEGTLVHFDGRSFVRHRAPDGALLAVAAVGPGEAWAVGLGGGLLHAKGGAVTAYHLVAEGGAPLRVALRAVAATGPDDVWIAGDRSLLLRWDGKSLARVDAGAAGSDAALTAVVPPRAGPGWVVGPAGVFRAVRAGP